MPRSEIENEALPLTTTPLTSSEQEIDLVRRDQAKWVDGFLALIRAKPGIGKWHNGLDSFRAWTWAEAAEPQ